MMAAWMVYSVLVASFAALAAATIDRLLAIWRLPRRYLWLGAMMIAALVPFVAATRAAPSRLTPPPLEEPPARAGSLLRPAAAVAPLQIPLGVRATRVLRRADRPARVLWMATSSIALVAFLGAFIMLRKRRTSWKTAMVDGQPTWIAPDVGPAVVGFVRPRIVLPEWALTLGDMNRGFVVRHESEHIRAGDPRLLLAAGLLLVAMPWNPALWWMTRRMRLAMEIDCDARVLRGTDAIREYGMLLLAVHARRGRTLPLVASLTEQQALLELRIVAMTESPPGRPRLVSAALGLVACAAAIAVAQTPVPQGADGRALGISGSATTDQVARQTPALIRTLVSDYYPTLSQGASPVNRITFVLDADGNYVASAAWTDTRPAFESVRVVSGSGSGGVGGRSVPAASRPSDAEAGRRQPSDGVRDFGALGFPNITSDAVMLTQSGWTHARHPVSVFVIRLAK